METRDHFKKGASPKSLTSRGNMKRVLMFLFAIICVGAVYGQPIRVAMLEPLGSVSNIQKAIIRAKLTEAFTNSGTYEALNRGDIDQLMKEYNFQNGGAVSEEQRQNLGRMSGAQLMCVTNVAADGKYFFAECSFIDLETGKIIKTQNQLIESSPVTKLEEGCIELAEKLIGETITGTTKRPKPARGELAFYSEGSNDLTKEEHGVILINVTLRNKVTVRKTDKNGKAYNDTENNDVSIGSGNLKNGFSIVVKDPTPGEKFLLISMGQKSEKLLVDQVGDAQISPASLKMNTSIKNEYEIGINKSVNNKGITIYTFGVK